jgi:membrane protease subunit HflK
VAQYTPTNDIWQAVQHLTTGNNSFVGDMRAAIGGLPRRRIAGTLILLLALAYLLSGVYVVAPGEVAVVRRFGAVVSPREGEGLHYQLPWPIDRVDIVNVSQVRRESVGLTQPEPEHPDHPEKPAKASLLKVTGA